MSRSASGTWSQMTRACSYSVTPGRRRTPRQTRRRRGWTRPAPRQVACRTPVTSDLRPGDPHLRSPDPTSASRAWCDVAMERPPFAGQQVRVGGLMDERMPEGSSRRHRRLSRSTAGLPRSASRRAACGSASRSRRWSAAGCGSGHVPPPPRCRGRCEQARRPRRCGSPAGPEGWATGPALRPSARRQAAPPRRTGCRRSGDAATRRAPHRGRFRGRLR